MCNGVPEVDESAPAYHVLTPQRRAERRVRWAGHALDTAQKVLVTATVFFAAYSWMSERMTQSPWEESISSSRSVAEANSTADLTQHITVLFSLAMALLALFLHTLCPHSLANRMQRHF